MDLKSDHIRAIIYYQWMQTKELDEIHQRINTVLGHNTVGFSTVTKWVREFKRGRQSLEDTPKQGRPVSVNTPENAAIVEDIIRADPSVTYHELEQKSGIPGTTLRRICADQLKVQKKLCRFVPHRLSDEQKKDRLEKCQQNLKLWKKGKDNTINKIVTGDEVYVYYYEPKLSREAKIFVFEDEEPPSVVRKEKTIGKILYAIFFSSSGLVDAVKLEGQRTVTALWYTTQCLPRVLEKGPKNGILLHHDNAPAHTACGLKHFLRGKAFSSEEEIDSAVMEYLESIEKKDWEEAFERWRRRMTKCIEAEGDYFE
ncbi:histone-lysine N-methyltransferase SETMAR-like [Oppia nitens]|uniref:histone-lysine N-methyltransferase SETMAR-like n=1 Tax=Oppia nitens TaxID=1686743 RepID=UPI0023DB1ABB|nr:histone-lysine N-methyltransferase SETMAR-like [Oppia nitens]